MSRQYDNGRRSDEPIDRADLQRQACRAAALRAAPGLVTYVLAALLLVLLSPLGVEHTAASVVLTVAALSMSLARIPLITRFDRLYARDAELWRSLFAAGVAGQITIWLVMCCGTVALYGVGWTGFFALLISAGIATAGAVAYAPMLAVARGFHLYMVAAHMVAFAIIGGREGLALGIAVVAFAGYLWIQIGKLSGEFWRGLENEQLLARRARELDKLRVRAEAAAVAKSEFLASASHEIRTPLNGIIGMTDLLMHSRLAASQRDYVATINRSADTLLALVTDLLDFAKVEADRLELDSADLRLSDLVRDVQELFRSAAEARGLALEVDIAPDISDTPVRGDPVRLSQILNNLVSNAIRYTESGSVLIRAEWVRRDVTVAVARIEVVDTGVGIPRSSHEEIFEKFTRLDASSTRKTGGTGLGLAICRRLCALMGGEIGVDSEPGQGSTFWFTVELARATEWVRRPDERPQSEPTRSGGTVLVAEDNEINQHVISAMLERQGRKVELVSTGREAIEAWERGGHELILMDCEMPDMDGLQATRQIRERELGAAHIPIIAMTALVMAGDRERCLEAGMDDFLPKPLRLDAVRSVLARWCAATPRVVRARGHSEAALETMRELHGDEVMRDLAVVFRRDTPIHVERLSRAVERGDLEGVLQAAHYLKGGAAMLGAVELRDLCSRLEVVARRGELSSAASLVEHIERKSAVVQSALD